MIPLFKVHMPKIDINKTLYSGYIGEGERVKEFEKKLECYIGKCVTLNSCTSALHLALYMAGVKGGEVISTPATCLATNMPIIHQGAKIVWADVDPSTGLIDVEDVFQKINKKTKAIMCVHYGGALCSNLLYVTRLPLIEDCAHRFNGGLGGYECYSFQAIKFLTTGDGGALVCKDIDRARLLRWYGLDRTKGASMRCEQDVTECGFKFHMNDINASIGIEQLKHINRVLYQHKNNARIYNEAFKDLKTIKTMDYEESDYWLYMLRVENPKRFIEFMETWGIMASQVHGRNDTKSCFKEFKCDLPGVDEFYRHQVAIPVGWWLTSENLWYIIQQVKEYDRICSTGE